MDLLISLMICGPLIYGFTHFFLPWNEKRSNLVLLPDFILDACPTYNMSWPITLSTLSSYLLIFSFINRYRFLYFLWSFTLLCWNRALCMTLCPFKVHPQNKGLIDYTLVPFFGHQQNQFRNDLMYSGHMAMTWNLWYLLPWQDYPSLLMPFILVQIISVPCFLILGKVHYSIDIVVAPFMTEGIRAIVVEYVLPWVEQI